MAEIKVSAQERSEKSTNKILADLRAARKLPATIYGGKGGAASVIVDERELMDGLGREGHNAIIHLKHGKNEDTVILKELQRHVVSGNPIHADFVRVDMEKKVDVEVPIHVHGEAPGVKLQGGILEHILRELKIQCLPGSIPQEFTVDVSKLEMGQGIRVRDLTIPSGVEVLSGPDETIVHIVQVRVHEEVKPEEGAEGEDAPQPESSSTKGKEKEEGAEGDAKEGGKKEGGK
ncbi:MAG: 50S ribosomal protein L25 [Elusimicrobia bacterium]|nr:MAG: 50S ribosomal protein L25 [Elusimicrobiota bacterium]